MPNTRSRLFTGLVAAALVVSASACSAGVSDTADATDDSPAATAPAATTPAATTPAATTPAGDGSVTLPPIVVPTLEIPTVPDLPTDDSGSSAPTTTTATGGSGAVLPEGFPLPPGASAVQGVRDDSEIASTLVVTDDQQAYDFWRSALPGAGYTVVSAESSGSLREIRFSGHGCTGDSQIAFNGPAIAIQCDLG